MQEQTSKNKVVNLFPRPEKALVIHPDKIIITESEFLIGKLKMDSKGGKRRLNLIRNETHHKNETIRSASQASNYSKCPFIKIVDENIRKPESKKSREAEEQRHKTELLRLTRQLSESKVILKKLEASQRIYKGGKASVFQSQLEIKNLNQKRNEMPKEKLENKIINEVVNMQMQRLSLGSPNRLSFTPSMSHLETCLTKKKLMFLLEISPEVYQKKQLTKAAAFPTITIKRKVKATPNVSSFIETTCASSNKSIYNSSLDLFKPELPEIKKSLVKKGSVHIKPKLFDKYVDDCDIDNDDSITCYKKYMNDLENCKKRIEHSLSKNEFLEFYKEKCKKLPTQLPEKRISLSKILFE